MEAIVAFIVIAGGIWGAGYLMAKSCRQEMRYDRMSRRAGQQGAHLFARLMRAIWRNNRLR